MNNLFTCCLVGLMVAACAVVAGGCTRMTADCGTTVLAREPGGSTERSPGEPFAMKLFDRIRIPKIVIAKDGSILAFGDSCKVMRRSTDQGASWTEEEVVNPHGGGNVIVDDATGDVLIVCPSKALVLRSTDHGKTWKEEPTEFKANLGGHGTPETARVDVACSESGITLQFGKHKGRLLMPARIQPPKANNAQEFWQYNYNTSIFSDDHGKTWQVSEPIMTGTGEGTLAELSTGKIYYNSRSHMSVDHRRRIAWSHDGGRRWVDWQVSEDLFEVGGPSYYKYGSKPSYGCNAGLVRVPSEATDGKDVLLYSAPDNPGAVKPHHGRIKMTVWASTDGAKSWPIKRLVYGGPSSYSSLAADQAGNVYLLFESGTKKLYEEITFARFDLKWVLESKARQ